MQLFETWYRRPGSSSPTARSSPPQRLVPLGMLDLSTLEHMLGVGMLDLSTLGHMLGLGMIDLGMLDLSTLGHMLGLSV